MSAEMARRGDSFPTRADYERARIAAYRILKENSVEAPPIDVDEITRNYVSDIEYARFKPPHDAIAGFIDFDRDAIVVNFEDPETRQRFTIAHELAHWVLHRDDPRWNRDLGVLMRRPIAGETDPLEQEANFFAACLLVPLRFIGKDELEVDTIERRFWVSREMAGYRKKSLEWEFAQLGR